MRKTRQINNKSDSEASSIMRYTLKTLLAQEHYIVKMLFRVRM